MAAELRHAEAAAEAARAEVAARKAEVAEATAAAEAALREAEERGPAAVAALEAALAKTRSAKAVAIAAASPVAHQVRMTLAEQEARKRLAEAAPEEWARFAAEAGLPEKSRAYRPGRIGPARPGTGTVKRRTPAARKAATV